MKTPEEIRKEKNKSLTERFKNGERLQLMEVSSSWWQPRPKIEKSKQDIDRVYISDKKED